ncbi:hypothetical protein BRD07_02740 [Halobacteriales archaeon QS_9_68_42]|nr:MAG: hypothetical protein BRD07_02740 [Halobacteriales archaeon QS_9_68_42]
MNASRRALLGTRRPRRRIAAATVGLLAGCTLAFLARLDVVIPLSGWDLGFIVFSAGLVVAAYAGWARGGAFPGVGSVSLLLLWMTIFPPVVGYLRGKKYSSPRYTTVRLSDVLLTPRSELELAVESIPMFLLGALLFGGAAFLVGAGARRLSGR